MHSLFKSATKYLDREDSADKIKRDKHTSPISGHRTFFHRVFYPLGTSRQKIQTAYKKTYNTNNAAKKSPPFSVATRKYTYCITNVMVSY